MTVSIAPSREQLEVLAQKIATLSLRIDAAKHQLLTYLREFDAHEGWAGSGALSTAAWLAWRIEIGPVAAREHVRVARALGQLPRLDAAFAAGELSYAKVRAITRVATPDNEQEFIEVGLHGTASHLEKVVSAYRGVVKDTERPAGSACLPRSQRRHLRRSETADGMVRLEVLLPPEQANVVWEALLGAVDAGRAEAAAARRAEASDDSAESGVTEWAEGVERDGSDDSAESRPRVELRRETDARTWEVEFADALVNVSQAYLDHGGRTLGTGYELVILTTPEQLEHAPNGVGGYLRDGTPVPQQVARMLACDCSRVDVDVGESGEILNVGRARRTIPSAIGRALWLRDGGCRVPGCDRKRHLHAHHIHHWGDGGQTSTANLVLLCTGHHAAVHEGELGVYVQEGKVVFENAHGLPLRSAGLRDADGDATREWLRAAELEFESTAYPRWDGSRLDLAAVIDGLCAASAWGCAHADV